MNDNTFAQHHHHQEFYRSTQTKTFHTLFNSDTIDACYENGRTKTERISYESKNVSSTVLNGQSKGSAETPLKEFSNNAETKSFIQQRVERLYGPGALAQGFFVTKKQQTRETESDIHHLNEHGQVEPNEESHIKLSNSSPALPVLRHLRPEFRAQLPIINPRKAEMQKSFTVPMLIEDVKANGHLKKGDFKESSSAACVIPEESGEKDGHYFLLILERESKRLLELADHVESELQNEDLSEEVVGIIRSAYGKARLLVSQKMQQFKGLCTNNITQNGSEPFPTTNEDLQGFWDMVMLQVDQVDALLNDIQVLKANNWQEIKEESKSKVTNGKPVARKLVIKPKLTSAASEEARKKRESQRKQLIEERRKAMKAQNKPLENIEIFVADSS